jgi:hypothetical protein
MGKVEGGQEEMKVSSIYEQAALVGWSQKARQSLYLDHGPGSGCGGDGNTTFIDNHSADLLVETLLN